MSHERYCDTCNYPFYVEDDYFDSSARAVCSNCASGPSSDSFESDDSQCRVCSACDEYVHSSYYSDNQWWKGVGESRCLRCVAANYRGGANSDPDHLYLRCWGCDELIHEEFYSNNQWRRGRKARCNRCVKARRFSFSPAPDSHLTRRERTVRRNDASETTYDEYSIRYPFEKGEFKTVAKEKYSKGPRAGQRAVMKWFNKTGLAKVEDSFFANELKVCEKAIDLVGDWNELQ